MAYNNVIKKKVFSNTKFSRLLFAFLIIGNCFVLQGLDPNRDIRQYNLEIFSTEDGLPQSSVLALVQARDGYIWLGTYEGAARFDGKRFEIFNKSNTPEMGSNRIKCLLEDQKGNLWLGTSGGLLLYSKGNFNNYTTADGLSNDFITALYEDKSGSLWIGTTKGLNRLKKGIFTAFTRQQGLSHEYIMSLVEQEKGNILIGTAGGGLYRFHDNKISRSPIPGLAGDTSIRVLYKDRQDNTWIGTGGSGLIKVSARGVRFYSKKNGLSGDDIRAIFSDSRGVLWVGSNGQGLNRLKNGSFTYSASRQGLLNSPIRSIIEDREGSLWVGTRTGLAQLKEGKFIIYNNRNGLPVDSVRTVFQDRDKNIWIGTVNGGLIRYKKGKFKTFGIKDGLKSKHIWTIAQSRDGSIWIGTYGEGLHRLKGDKIRQIYTTQNGLSNNIIRAVFVDRRDRIWVGTNGGGVDVIKDGMISNYSTKNGLADNFVYAINEDNKGNIWIGNYQGSINVYADGMFKLYNSEDGLTGHAIWSILPDEDDVTWIGTDGGGLLRFKDNKFTRFTVKDGLYSDLVFQVLEDLDENLWMNCNQGIFYISKKNIADFLTGGINKIPCVSFGKSQGIKNTECNGPAQPAGICSSGGKLWFPTIRGVVVIDPGNIKINNVTPATVIEEMIVDEKTVYSYSLLPEAGLVLPPGKKRIEFKFTGLSFTAPARVRFNYMLAGYDKKWLAGGTRRRVSYTNIPPGEYTFRVTACNNDGKWDKQGAYLSFKLKPFFWQTWWFRFLLIIAFSLLSYLIIGFIRTHMDLISFWKKKNRIASFAIDEQIGVGGMGVIYKVHSQKNDRKTYAMKVMKEEYLLDKVQKERFKKESILVDRLDHPNIVKVYERGEDNDRLYIVMELLQGETLADRYERNDYPTVARCIHILRQLADILVTLYREGIIHRDLKPENIMLITQNEDPDFVKLLDFGIARMKTFTHLTETGHVLGTLPYMPPEVISDGILSLEVDIYSLGIIGYEMLTRRKPFPAENPAEVLNQIINRKPTHPISINPQTPQKLNYLILKMLEKNPAHRPDAFEVLSTLNNIYRTIELLDLKN